MNPPKILDISKAQTVFYPTLVQIKQEGVIMATIILNSLFVQILTNC